MYNQKTDITGKVSVVAYNARDPVIEAQLVEWWLTMREVL
jgi:hypothetical protein